MDPPSDGCALLLAIAFVLALASVHRRLAFLNKAVMWLVGAEKNARFAKPLQDDVPGSVIWPYCYAKAK